MINLEQTKSLWEGVNWGAFGKQFHSQYLSLHVKANAKLIEYDPVTVLVAGFLLAYVASFLF